MYWRILATAGLRSNQENLKCTCLPKACIVLGFNVALHDSATQETVVCTRRTLYPDQTGSASFTNRPQHCRLILRPSWIWHRSCPIGGGPLSHTACMGCWCTQATPCILATTLPLSRRPMACGISWMTTMSARCGLPQHHVGSTPAACAARPVIASAYSFFVLHWYCTVHMSSVHI